MADQPEAFAVEVNGKRYDVDLMMLTLGERHRMKVELAKLEGDTDGWDFTAGMIWTVVRRAEPDITLAEIMDAVTVGAVAAGAEAASDSPEV